MKVAERGEQAQPLTGSSPLFDKERATVTLQELSKFLGIPRKTIYSWVYRGVLPQPLKFPQKILFVREEIVAWLQTYRRGANDA